MDPAVSLVQAYLRVNGFFTVTEYPIVSRSKGPARTVTDVDVLALRFPAAQTWVPAGGKKAGALPIDDALGLAEDRMQMIIGEVKEGKARMNAAAYSPDVLEAVLRRFGCCETDPGATARAVARKGEALTHGHCAVPCHIRMVVFSGRGGVGRFQRISLAHIARFLIRHLSENDDVLLSTQLKDDALALMALLVKTGTTS